MYMKLIKTMKHRPEVKDKGLINGQYKPTGGEGFDRLFL